MPLSQPPNLGFLDIIGFAQAATAERQKEGFGGRKKRRRRRRRGGRKGLGRREKWLLTGRYTHAGQALAHAGWVSVVGGGERWVGGWLGRWVSELVSRGLVHRFKQAHPQGMHAASFSSFSALFLSPAHALSDLTESASGRDAVVTMGGWRVDSSLACLTACTVARLSRGCWRGSFS